MNAVHPTALAGWGGHGAEDYEAGRPGYPPAAVTLIGEQLDVGREGPAAILDLAAGTGKLTRQLGVLGVEVIAVEPVAAMRAQLSRAAPGARILAGTAEAIPLPDGAVQAVTVAQAFHWFDVPRAAAEITRVLAPGGGLAILRNDWNRRDASAGWAGAVGRLLEGATSPPETHGRDWRAELEATHRFQPLSERVIANQHTVDLDGLLLRIASMSFVAALAEPERAALLGAVEALLRDHGLRPGTPVAMPEQTTVLWGRRR